MARTKSGEEKAAHPRTRIGTAPQRDRLLRHRAGPPIVHRPLPMGSRATMELRGQVSTLWLRRAALRAAEREAAVRAVVSDILDRMAVVPSMKALAV